MQAQYVTHTETSVVTHAIRGGVPHYDRPMHTLCGLATRAVEHMQSGAELDVTCRNCQRRGASHAVRGVEA